MGLFTRREEPAQTRGLRADPHLSADLPAVASARGGDVAPLSVRLGELRDAGSWDHRDALLQRAASGIDGSTDWLDAWLSAEPDSQDALALRSHTLVAAAGAGPGRQADHDLLVAAGDALDEAARRSPDDPSVWAPLFDHCLGLDLGLERLHDLVSRATEHAPSGFGWRLGAVDALSPFGFGSLEESWDFAVTSTELYPDSRLMLLPALAATRGLWHERTDTGNAMIRQALPPALEYVREVDDEVEQVETANLMAGWLHAAGLGKQAGVFAQVAADRVATVPWVRLFDSDPLAEFASAARP